MAWYFNDYLYILGKWIGDVGLDYDNYIKSSIVKHYLNKSLTIGFLGAYGDIQVGTMIEVFIYNFHLFFLLLFLSDQIIINQSNNKLHFIVQLYIK